jgi:hypothetical protein
MGYYCYTLISFPVDDQPETKKKLWEIANNHLERLKQNEDSSSISSGFLCAVAEGNGFNCHHKGSAFAYAAVGNYVNIDQLVKDLLPFFDELWETDYLHLFHHEHVIIMVNPEQRLKTRIAEIVQKDHMFDECASESLRTGEFYGNRVRMYDADWSWHQM